MSLLDVLQLIRRIHAANGRLEAINGHFNNIQSALAYNPRNSETWDIFNLRDDRLVQISRSCARADRLFNRLARGRTTVRSYSSDLSRLFANWAAAFAAHGEGSRQLGIAKTEFGIALVNAHGELLGIEREADAVSVDLRKYKKFYTLQQRIFSRMEDLARRFLRFWPSSTNAPKAFSIMQSSEDIKNASQRIVRFIDRAISNLRTQKRAINVERRQLETWNRWLANNRNVQRDIERNRAPI